MSENASAFLKLGAEQRDMRDQLRDLGPFNDGLAACRLAVVLSLLSGGEELPLEGAQNVYNKGTFDDEEGSLAAAVMELTGVAPADVYPKMSRMANWGVTQLHSALRGENLSIMRLVSKLDG